MYAVSRQNPDVPGLLPTYEQKGRKVALKSSFKKIEHRATKRQVKEGAKANYRVAGFILGLISRTRRLPLVVYLNPRAVRHVVKL